MRPDLHARHVCKPHALAAAHAPPVDEDKSARGETRAQPSTDSAACAGAGAGIGRGIRNGLTGFLASARAGTSIRVRAPLDARVRGPNNVAHALCNNLSGRFVPTTRRRRLSTAAAAAGHRVERQEVRQLVRAFAFAGAARAGQIAHAANDDARCQQIHVFVFEAEPRVSRQRRQTRWPTPVAAKAVGQGLCGRLNVELHELVEKCLRDV